MTHDCNSNDFCLCWNDSCFEYLIAVRVCGEECTFCKGKYPFLLLCPVNDCLTFTYRSWFLSRTILVSFCSFCWEKNGFLHWGAGQYNKCTELKRLKDKQHGQEQRDQQQKTGLATSRRHGDTIRLAPTKTYKDTLQTTVCCSHTSVYADGAWEEWNVAKNQRLLSILKYVELG